MENQTENRKGATMTISEAIAAEIAASDLPTPTANKLTPENFTHCMGVVSDKANSVAEAAANSAYFNAHFADTVRLSDQTKRLAMLRTLIADLGTAVDEIENMILGR